MRGFFVVFEGGDGVGKSTQIDLLAVWLRSVQGGSRRVTTTREPGGTELGKELRAAVMHGGHVDPRSEALLYAADRAHHVATVVRPALERGDIVVQDRYIDSSIVYQGGARGLGDEVERISRWATEGLEPDLTVLLDLDPADARLSAGSLDRVERETAARAAEMRDHYLRLAARAPGRYAVIDASESVELVHREVKAALAEAMAHAASASAAEADDGVDVVAHRGRRHT